MPGSPDFIPDNQFKPDAAPAQSGSADFIPDEQFVPDEEKYGTPGQQLLTGAEGVAQGLAGPLATGAELGLSKMGVPGLSAEEQAGRKEANPWTHGIGETAGLVGGALTGVGEAGLIAKGAEAIPLVSKIAEAGSLGKIGSVALKGAIENGAIQGGDEISKAMLGQGDPEAPVSSALAHMGAASLFGGVAGGIFGTAAEGLNAIAATKAGQAASGALEDLGARVSLPTEADLIAEDALTKSLPKLKTEAPEILDAAQRLDLPVMNGMVSGDKAVQMGEDALLRGPPTVPAIKRQGLYNQAYEKALGTLNEVVPAAEITKAQAGQALQEGITKQIAQQYEPINQMYDAIHEITPNIPLSKFSAPAIARNILKMPEVIQTPNSPMARFARSVAENIQNAKTVEDISFQRKSLKDMANSTIPGERRMAAIIADKLSDWESSTITKYASNLNKSLAASSPEEQQIFKDVSAKINGLIPQMQGAKAAYAPFIQDVSRIAQELGKGKVHGAQDAMDFINNLDFEQLTNRLAKKDNSQFREWFAGKFPQEYGVLQNYQKAALRKEASKTGVFSPKVFFNKVNSMEPEIQKSIFNPQDLQKIKDVNTYIRAFPESFNPSGTSHMSAFRSFFESPTGAVIGNARDLAIQHLVIGKDMSPKVLKALGHSPSNISAAAATKALAEGSPEGVHSSLEYAKQVERGARKINAGVGALFKYGGQQAIDAVASEKDREKVKKFIEKGGLNQQMQNQMQHYQGQGSGPQSFAEGGMVQDQKPIDPQVQDRSDHLAKIYPDQNMMMNAAKSRIYNYLNSLRPQQNPAKLPFDKAPNQSVQEKKYDKAIDLANQPLSILNSVKDGSITMDELGHFNKMFPELHNHLAKEITKKITESQMKDEEAPKYHTRQGLSMFLAAPMDSTFTPMSIQAAQATFAAQKAAQQAPQPKTKRGTSKLGEISKQYETANQAAQARQTSEH